MNKQRIPALILLILGLVVAVGSQSFLGPCVHADGSFGPCHWAGRALLGVGGLLSGLALMALIVPAEGARLGLYLAAVAAAALGLLTPGTLIALCQSDAMRCRMVMLPATRLLFILALIAAAAGGLLARGRTKRA